MTVLNAQWRIGNPSTAGKHLGLPFPTLNLSLGFGAIKTKLAAPFAVAIATSRPTPPKGAWSGLRLLRILLKPSAARPAN